MSEVDADLVGTQLHRVVIACNLVVLGRSYGAFTAQTHCQQVVTGDVHLNTSRRCAIGHRGAGPLRQRGRLRTVHGQETRAEDQGVGGDREKIV